MFESKANATFIGLLAYLLLVLAAPVGKLLGLARLAQVSWSQATCLVWGSWLLALACWLLLGLLRLGEELAKIKNKNDLTLPRT